MTRKSWLRSFMRSHRKVFCLTRKKGKSLPKCRDISIRSGLFGTSTTQEPYHRNGPKGRGISSLWPPKRYRARRAKRRTMHGKANMTSLQRKEKPSWKRWERWWWYRRRRFRTCRPAAPRRFRVGQPGIPLSDTTEASYPSLPSMPVSRDWIWMRHTLNGCIREM